MTKRRWTTVALALFAAIATVGAADRDGWTTAQLEQLRSLSLAELEPLPADPTNRFADDPRAADLGRDLFFDPRLSSNGRVACSTCHRPEQDFQDGVALASGVGTTSRRTMPVAAAARAPFLFWDGRKDSLWAQALGPLESPVEHGGTRAQYAHTVAAHYRSEYEEVFGNLYGTLRSEIRQAMAQESFERMIFDVDVKGALSLRRAFPDDTFLCFIAPPSKEILGERLRARKTETPESIAIRLARVDMEMAVAHEFDAIVVNDLLERAVMEIEGYVERGMPRRDAR